MRIKRKSVLLAVLLAAAMLFTAACGIINSLVGGGGAKATSLWADVPAMEGMTQENIELPLPIKLAVQAMVQASGASEGVRVDNFEVIAFTSAKTPDDLRGFYTNERMQAAGWNLPDQPGCAGGTVDQQVAGGTFCMFGKQGAKNQSYLVVVGARDDKDAKMHLFFMRFDGDLTATPTGR